ncbi:putative DNA binding CopG/RHH family protein [Paenibacillus mucilaginosus]|uniref:hypothetical protein n=1 Tax=Paenibacillus mucilaginosus TaxID=61624 RepID=UPI003D2462A0
MDNDFELDLSQDIVDYNENAARTQIMTKLMNAYEILDQAGVPREEQVEQIIVRFTADRVLEIKGAAGPLRVSAHDFTAVKIDPVFTSYSQFPRYALRTLGLLTEEE